MFTKTSETKLHDLDRISENFPEVEEVALDEISFDGIEYDPEFDEDLALMQNGPLGHLRDEPLDEIYYSANIWESGEEFSLNDRALELTLDLVF